MLKLKVLILTCFMVLTGCQKQATRYSSVALDVGFKDIAISFIAYTDTEEEFNHYFDELTLAYQELGHLYDKYNNFDGLTNLKTLNDTAGQGPQVVDQRLIDLLLLSQEWDAKSLYTFNPTLGTVLKVWHTYREEGKILNQEDPTAFGKIPSLAELESANACTGWNNLVIDDEANTVEILNPCTSIDVGGIGKGYATDLVAQQMIESGLTSAILNIGDSSIVTIGSKPDGTEWGIGVAKPSRPVLIGQATVDTLYFTGSISVSTSGDNQNYYVAEDGNYYHHLIDPSTLYPVVTPLHSVTVVTNFSAGEAEALSKALYILPYDQASAYLSELQTQYPNNFIGALWVFELDQAPIANNVINSEGFSLIHSDNLIEHSRLYR